MISSVRGFEPIEDVISRNNLWSFFPKHKGKESEKTSQMNKAI